MASHLLSARPQGATQSMLALVLCMGMLMMSATTGRAMRIPGDTFSSVDDAEAARQSEWMKWAQSMQRNTTAPRSTFMSINASAKFEQYEADFKNRQLQPGWGSFAGRSGPGQEGYLILSTPGDPEGRMKFEQGTFNTPERPNTYIHARFRGAPDSGKISYIALKEARCPAAADHNCDVVAISEVFGIDKRAEATYYKQGKRQQAGPARLVNNGGSRVVDYKMWLFRGKRVIICGDRAEGNCQADWYNGIPDQPLNLFAGEWDCSFIPGSESWCGSRVKWETNAVLEYVYILRDDGTGNGAADFKAGA